MIVLIAFQTKCNSQVPYDYVLCENVRIYKGGSENYLTTCSINEKNIKQAFGMPDTIIIVNNLPPKYEKVCFGSDLFSISFPDVSWADFAIRTEKFRLIVKDSIEIKVGTSIERVLRFFPKSALNQKQSENGDKYLLLYLNDKSELEDIKMSTSRLKISYRTSNKKIVLIEKIDLD